MPRIFLRILTAFILLIIVQPAVAQKKVTHQSNYWIRYFGKYAFSPKWGATLEVEDRRFFTDNRQANWMLPRVALTRSLGSGWGVAAGFTYYTTANPSDPDSKVLVTVPELRPHQDVSYTQKIKRLTIGHRYRLEERFRHKATADELTAGYQFSLRARYRLGLQYSLIQKEGGTGTLKVKVSDELMLNLGHSVVYNFFDQNRLYVGLNYGISPSIQAELGYVNIFQQKKTGSDYVAGDVARLTVYHTLKFFR